MQEPTVPPGSNHSGDKRMTADPRLPSKGQVSPAGLNALVLLLALQRRWILALLLGLPLAAGTVAGVWYFVPPPRPTASAKLYMPVDPEGIVYKHPEASQNFQNYQATQIALIKSRLVLNAALREPRVAALSGIQTSRDPVAWLEAAIRIDSGGSPEIIQLSITGGNAAELKTILEAVVKSYLVEVVDKQKKRRKERMDELQKHCNLLEESVKRAQERRHQALAKGVGLTEHSVSDKLIEHQNAATWKDLGEVRTKLRDLQWELKTFESRANGQQVTMANLIDDYVDRDPILAKYNAEKILQELDNEKSRGNFRDPQDPARKANEQKLEEVNAKIEARRKDLRETAQKKLLGQSENYSKASQEDLKSRIQSFEEFEKNLVKDLEKLDRLVKGHLEQGALAEEDKLFIEREVKKLELFAMERDKLAIEYDDPARVRSLEDTDVHTPENTLVKQATMPAAAGAVVFGLVLLGVAFCEYRIHRVSDPEQIADRLGARLLGTVPAPPNQFKIPFSGKLRTQNIYQAGLTEAVDTVRTLLVYEARHHAFRTLLVTSAVSGEGKTSLSAHLAVSLARSGRRVLLLDCDIRCPSCHNLFNMPLAPGFSELLRGQAGLPEVIRETTAANLFLLSAGQCDRKAIEILGQDSAGQWFERVKEQFDFVIIDSSPVLPVNDTTLIGQHADVVLFSVLQGVSRLPKVQKAMHKITGCGARILGVVVNGTATEGLGYGSGDGYRYLDVPTPSTPSA
jgi:polysaccharide biosynthesis transport protein